MAEKPSDRSITLQQAVNAGESNWGNLKAAGGGLRLDKAGSWRKRLVTNPEALSPAVREKLGIWSTERKAALERGREARAGIAKTEIESAQPPKKEARESTDLGVEENPTPVYKLPGGKEIKWTLEEKPGKDPVINILAADNCPRTPETKFSDYYRTEEGDTFKSIADQYVDAEGKPMSTRVVKKAYEETMQRPASSLPYIPENLLFKIPAGYRFIGRDSERTIFQKPNQKDSLES